MDGLNLSSILNLPSVLDCLPPFVRKFWSPPLVARKYVKTSTQGFFSYGALRRSVRASQVNKIFTLVVLVFVSLVLLIPIMVMLFLLTLISFQGPA
jgi:lipopolysaccharide/colanic/teichoic acid biosynthesis glycosyltransferase